MSNARPTNASDVRKQYQHQTILTPNRVDIRVTEVKANLFQRICEANKTDETCEEYRSAIANGIDKLHGIRLEQCRIVDGALYKRGLLWVPEQFYTELLQEVHDQPSVGHPGIKRTISQVRRHYL